MRINNTNFYLRKPELSDVQCFYEYKNDIQTSSQLGGFHTGYSSDDITEWIKRVNNTTSDIVWSIADRDTDLCVGHVGLYNIDHRARKAEIGICIGLSQSRGKGLGTNTLQVVIDYAFLQLNVNRLSLLVLANNPRAHSLYKRLGFVDEGLHKSFQYKDGTYIDAYSLALLRHDYVS